MKKQLFKILLAGVGSILILFFAFVQTREVQTQHLVKVHFLDIGQGDSIFIQTPSGHDILIDGGQDASVLYELGRVMPFWDFDIDTVIATHPHSDHIGGLTDVLEKYNVGQLYLSGVPHTTDEYFSLLETIRDKNIETKLVTGELLVDLGEGVSLRFIYPRQDISGQEIDELNNTSIITQLVYGQTDFLFTGDAEKEVEQELVDAGIDIKSDILKVGHHGSRSSTTYDFLQAVSPELGVIQVGADNRFNHPHMSVVKRLEQQNVEILRTDQDGTVSIVTDGLTYWHDERSKNLDFLRDYDIVVANLVGYFTQEILSNYK